MPRLPSFPKPLVLAHRMLVPGYPENCIISLKEAVKFVDWVEFDVKVLTDGTIVSLHDSTVDRTTDGTGDITKMDYAHVKTLNAGKGYDFGFVRIPRVEEILEVLGTCGRFVRAEMHIHNLWEPEPLVALLDKYHVRDRCYFNLNAMMMGIYMREELHDSKSLLSLNAQAESPEMKDLCNQYDLAYLCVPHKILNADFVSHVHGYRKTHPVFVHCYPVQNEADWRRMIDIGVDVIQTDYPDGLASFITDNVL